MKKIFTLFAALVVVLCVNAQEAGIKPTRLDVTTGTPIALVPAIKATPIIGAIENALTSETTTKKAPRKALGPAQY